MARFGVRLENDPNLSPQDYQELASQAEKNGFEAVWVPEGGGRDSLTSLATIAMKTNSVKLATGILPSSPARRPTPPWARRGWLPCPMAGSCWVWEWGTPPL